MLKSMELIGVGIRSGRGSIWTAWVSCTTILMWNKISRRPSG